MRSAIAGFVIGVSWLQFQAALPDHFILWLLFAAALLVGSLSLWQQLSKLSSTLRLVCGVLSSFSLAVWTAPMPSVWIFVFALGNALAAGATRLASALAWDYLLGAAGIEFTDQPGARRNVGDDLRCRTGFGSIDRSAAASAVV